MPHPPPRQEIVLVTHASTPILNQLEEQGFRVLAVEDCSSAVQVTKGHPFDAVLVALDCSHQEDFLRRIRENDPALQVLVLSDAPPRDGVIQDVSIERLSSTTQVSELGPVICRAIELTRLRRDNTRMRRQLSVLAPDTVIGLETGSANTHTALGPTIGSDVDLASITSAHVKAVLSQHGGNKAQTARALGINRRSLYRLLEKYGP